MCIRDRTNSATLAIEPLGSLLQVTGNYVQSSVGALVVGLQSTDPGTGYDRLQIGGQANLSGTLTVTRPTGYVPANGETFPVVTFLARIGQFAAIAGLDFGNGNQLTPVYNATNLTLQAPVAGFVANTHDTFTLNDAAGMAYTIDCQATITLRQAPPGIPDQELTAIPPLATLYALTLNGQPFPCMPQQRAAAGLSRPLVYGPAVVDGTTVLRVVQVATDGNYLRNTEVFINESTVTRTVAVDLTGALAFGADTRIVASKPDLPYMVAGGDLNGPTDLPFIAQVFGGAGAAQLPAASYAAGDGGIGLRWPALTLAPGQTVRLVYFVLYAPVAEAEALDAQARGLATLTADQVAVELPDVDAATVVNFAPAAPAIMAPRLYLPLVAGEAAEMQQQAEGAAPVDAAAPELPEGSLEGSPMEAPEELPEELPEGSLMEPPAAMPDAADASVAPTGVAEDAVVPAVFLPLVFVE